MVQIRPTINKPMALVAQELGQVVILLALAMDAASFDTSCDCRSCSGRPDFGGSVGNCYCGFRLSYSNDGTSQRDEVDCGHDFDSLASLCFVLAFALLPSAS